MAGTYELKRAGAQYMFNLKGGNGEKILTSETYAAKSGAQNGIQSVRVNSPYDQNYRRGTATNGAFYFALIASNGEALGRSEMYTTQAARETGIQSCKTNGPTAPVDDQT
jgi:uncharacterized protein